MYKQLTVSVATVTVQIYRQQTRLQSTLNGMCERCSDTAITTRTKKEQEEESTVGLSVEVESTLHYYQVSHFFTVNTLARDGWYRPTLVLSAALFHNN